MAVQSPVRYYERLAGAPSACRVAAHCSSEGALVCSLRVWSPLTSVIARGVGMAVRRPLRDYERLAEAPAACRGAALRCSSGGSSEDASVCSLRVWSRGISVIATTSSAATCPPSGARRGRRRVAPELRVRLQGQPVRGRRRPRRLLPASRSGMPARDPASHRTAAAPNHPQGAQGPPLAVCLSSWILPSAPPLLDEQDR